MQNANEQHINANTFVGKSYTERGQSGIHLSHLIKKDHSQVSDKDIIDSRLNKFTQFIRRNYLSVELFASVGKFPNQSFISSFF